MRSILAWVVLASILGCSSGSKLKGDWVIIYVGSEENTDGFSIGIPFENKNQERITFEDSGQLKIADSEGKFVRCEYFMNPENKITFKGCGQNNNFQDSLIYQYSFQSIDTLIFDSPKSKIVFQLKRVK